MAWYRSTVEGTEVRRGGGFVFGLLLVVVILLVVAIATGIIYFRRTDSTTEIIIDEQKVEAGAERAVEKGKSVLRETGKQLQDIGEKEPSPTPD